MPNRQRFFHLSLGCLPAPSNKMPSPPFRRLCTRPRTEGGTTCVRWFGEKTNVNSQSVAIAPSPPSFPLKYGAPFAVYGSILDSYGAAATSFDLAVQQRGNNSGRSLKGERLRMSLGSVLRQSSTPRITHLGRRSHSNLSGNTEKRLQIRPET